MFRRAGSSSKFSRCSCFRLFIWEQLHAICISKRCKHKKKKLRGRRRRASGPCGRESGPVSSAKSSYSCGFASSSNRTSRQKCTRGRCFSEVRSTSLRSPRRAAAPTPTGSVFGGYWGPSGSCSLGKSYMCGACGGGFWAGLPLFLEVPCTRRGRARGGPLQWPGDRPRRRQGTCAHRLLACLPCVPCLSAVKC